LELEIDFDNKIFHGRQTLHMRTHKFDVKKVYLDIRDITVLNITEPSGKVLDFEIDNPNPNLGQRLKITIPTEWIEFETFQLIIDYTTSTSASAVTWLSKEQTSGKKQPYMYTQCESIHARSIAPLQDTPSVKATYSLAFTTPLEIVTRASGNLTHEFTDETKRYTNFEMSIPIQSYLLAIASGNLAEKQVGKRTYVITEPEDLERAANEFEELETFLETAENYTIPYEWGVYKLLILPPSFPFGGMENPLLTFASPAIVVGDKSSVDVGIHEICHSWFGNLVTNVNWSNFWLNEGFTVFHERKVVSKVDSLTAAKVSAKLENQTMYFDMIGYGMDNSYSSLTPIFNGAHPDDAFSNVPYEKGFQFLTYLESLVSEDKFQEFLQSYLKAFQKTSISSEDFVDHFTSFVKKNFSWKESKAILDQIDFKTWIEGPGLPPVIVDLDTPEYNAAINLAESFLNGSPDPSASDIYSGFSVNLKGLFLSHMIQYVDRVTSDIAANVDNTVHVSQEINGEIVFRWLEVAVRSGYHAAPFDTENEFLGSIGRMKFVTPIYQAIHDVAPDNAQQIYAGHRDFYHPIARDAIEDILKGTTVLASI
jgi:leukotriene-A4 hydrolase